MKERVKVFITGVVQGVGFRPFVFNLAQRLKLKGYVLNSELGVVVEAEGKREELLTFLKKLQEEKPRISKIYSLEYKFLEPIGYEKFEIKESKRESEAQVAVLPDISTCKECLRELFDPENRRYRYPFINCTNCGPRFTIILSLPYDRERTTMKEFKMCKECLKEYLDPKNRRFHAQPNACPKCGPHVWLIGKDKEPIATKEEALIKTVEMINEGKIVAVKGLGGFHLICDATNQEALKELRRRKLREEKPFAVMFKDLEQVKRYAFVSKEEEIALTGIESPIVILKSKGALPKEVSPDTETVGAFLPYTPLHHLLLKELNKPIVATSCNITDEPIIKDNEEAVEIVGKIADGALLHNRKIARRCDDSVVRIINRKSVPIRRSRGFAPLPVLLPFSLKRKVLALGAHMKNTVALGKGNRVYLSQHVGDIDNYKAEEFLKETVKDLIKLLEVEPDLVVCDYHPNYFTTKWAQQEFKGKVVKVYHHHAHVISVMAENELNKDEEVIGLAFDGTGYGEDGTIWGGEFLTVTYTAFKRELSLLPFPLVGGDRAVKEPFRSAVSLLISSNIEPERVLKVDRRKLYFIIKAVEKGINSTLTSSMGRLFDGISAILGIKYEVSYQAQGAILLEEKAQKGKTEESYTVKVENGKIDWREMVREVVKDLETGAPKEEIARKFHNWVVSASICGALLIREKTGINTVALSGGVFQNKLLTETLEGRLKREGFKVITHQIVPPNDGGISLGQAVYGGLIDKED